MNSYGKMIAQPIRDYRLTRMTIGVCASLFAANMAVKQNALDHQQKYPQAVKAALEAFYVDDDLVGADSVDSAIHLQRELQCLFALGGFQLRKWKASNRIVEQYIAQHLRDQQPSCLIKYSENYAKVLGLEWDITDTFRPMVSSACEAGRLTKWQLMSSIAKPFDIMGWFSPAIIIPKVLLQRLWEERVGWDEMVPSAIGKVWERWSREIGDFRNYSFQEATSLKKPI